jgi:hypothetical protein
MNRAALKQGTTTATVPGKGIYAPACDTDVPSCATNAVSPM